MIKKLIPLFLLLNLCVITSVNAQNIIWVAMMWDADSDGVNDSQEWVDMLRDEGYTIDFSPGYWDALTADRVAELNTADLVIVSATTQSGVLATDAAESSLWNSVTSPMMNCCTYALRSTRWNWVNNGDAELPNNNGDQGSPLMQVLEPGHPIFTGISLDANNQVQVADPTLGSGQCTFIGTADAGNGTLISKTVGNEWIWIAEWEEGVEFYDGAGTYATNLRMTFSIGGHEVEGNGRDVNPARGYNLTDEGWTLFLNSVQYMLGLSINPGKAGRPSPSNGTEDLPRDTVLSWRPGVYAAAHNVYLGTEFDDVNEASVTDTRGVLISPNQNVNSYTPDLLDWNKTYYWRIDEVNDLEPNSPWKGNVWSFTTLNYIVVDNFEDYNDYPPDEIYNTWLDGWNDPANGSTSGHPAPDFVGGEHYLEHEFVHEGLFSFPVYYDNSAGLSEVTRYINADWTVDDVITFTLFYYGDAANAVVPMYVALNDDVVIINEDPRAALDNEWNQWDILLQDIADMGVDITNVNSLSIGFGNKDNPTTGGSGCVFFDDIRLYRSSPVEVEPEPEAVDPGTANLVAYYDFENDVQDGSGHGRHATTYNDPIYVSGPTDFGTALELDGLNDYIELPIGSVISTLTDCTIATWVNWSGQANTWQRIFDFGSPPASDDEDPMFYMFITTDAGGGNLRFAIKNGETTGGAEDQSTSSDVFPSGWQHVAVTIDSGNNTHTLYLNGKVIAQNTAPRYTPSDLGVTTQNWIGRSQWSDDPYFGGAIDEFRIYNRVLSDAELFYLMGR